MIQGGDPASRNAQPFVQLGTNQIGGPIDAEIVHPKYFHKRGAIAAARKGDALNPHKMSSGSQFYIVQGEVFSDSLLNDYELRMNNRIRPQIFQQLQPEYADTIRYCQQNGLQDNLIDIQIAVMGRVEEELEKRGQYKFTDEQREAYNSYLENLQNTKREFREVLCSYYKDHYEEFNRNYDLTDVLNLDVVNSKVTLSYFNPLQLFIDREGNFGWLSNFISSQYLISVVLSDGKPRIFKGWNVLKLDYGRVEDDVFGEMFFDKGWKKWIKTDINGVDGEWLEVTASAVLSNSKLTPGQKTNYQKYLQNEESFLAEYPKVLLEYYKNNYDVIEDMWRFADLYDAEDMDEKSIKKLVRFQRLYFHRDGKRYGWLCECAWDEVYGLSIYYDNTKEGICIGSIDSLVI